MTGEIKVNSILRFIHEPLGYNTDLKVVKITEYHPLLNKPVEVDFSNEREDIISIQLDINKKLRNINTGNVFSFTSSSADIGLSTRSEEHTSELQSRFDLVCRLL